MTEESQPWTNIFTPRTIIEVLGNERAITQFKSWLRSWNKGIPKQRAVFLFGPPGVGKTSSVVALANDLGFDLFEVNASDYRTKKRLDGLVGRAAMQTHTITGRRRMILFDELEGVSGVQDRGGISAIAAIIKETRVPIVLVATSIGEGWEEKFRPLVRLALQIEFKPVPFGEVVRSLKNLAKELGITVDDEVLDFLADRSEGDLRSAINDFETIARVRKRVTLSDAMVISKRDRKNYTPDALMAMFSAKTLRDARKIISSSYIGYDELFDWIYENLPLVLDNSEDLVEGIDALAKADIHQTRAKRTQNYRLLKYMFNAMTGGVALARSRSEGVGLKDQVTSVVARLGFSKNAFMLMETPDGLMIKPVKYLGKDWRRVNTAFRGMGANWIKGGGGWIVPYFRPPQAKWRYIRTYQSRRRLKSVAERVAEKCHISRKEAISEVIPLLRVIIKEDQLMADGISQWLKLEEKEAEWLKS